MGDLTIGEVNEGDGATFLFAPAGQAGNGEVLHVENKGPSGIAVSAIAFRGNDGLGLVAQGTDSGVLSSGLKCGVHAMVEGSAIGVHAESAFSADDGIAVLAEGGGDAVKGITGSSDGHAGVVGIATAAGGVGAAGYAQGDGGSTGLLGKHNLGTGPGVRGVSDGTEGVGVVGENSTGDAVKGITGSSDGHAGVVGIATAAGGVGAAGYAQGDGGSTGLLGKHNLGTGPGVRGVSDGAEGVGVVGENSTGDAVKGITGSSDGHAGVVGIATGDNGRGVAGYAHAGTSSVGVYALHQASGVAILAEAELDGHAICGRALAAGGTAVEGVAASGVAVRATANPDGRALEVNGTARFSRSGVAIVAGSEGTPLGTVTISDVTLTPNSIVLATIQSESVPGLAVACALPDVTSGKVTIHLTGPSATNVAVGWFVIN